MDEKQLLLIEQVFQVTLPNDFKDYIKENPSTTALGELTWSSDPHLIKKVLMKEFKDSLTFDMENSDYWPKVLGKRPSDIHQRVDKAMSHLETLSPLLPINGLKNLMPTQTEDPHANMPILSFDQFVDTIYMYKDLGHFIKGVRLTDEERQEMPRVSGWNKIFDGIGAPDSELYLE